MPIFTNTSISWNEILLGIYFTLLKWCWNGQGALVTAGSFFGGEIPTGWLVPWWWIQMTHQVWSNKNGSVIPTWERHHPIGWWIPKVIFMWVHSQRSMHQRTIPQKKNQHFLVGAIDKPFPVMAGLLHCFNHIRGFKHHTVVERLTIMFNMVLPI